MGEEQYRQGEKAEHHAVTLDPRKRRFTVDLPGTRLRHWESEFISIDERRGMTESAQLIRCDRRYLAVCFSVQLVVLTLLILSDLILWKTVVVAVLGGTLALFAFLRWVIRKTWKFKISADQIRTQKLFTGHIDLRTPLDQVVGINAYEGIFGASGFRVGESWPVG